MPKPARPPQAVEGLFCADCGGALLISEKPAAWTGPSRWVYLCQNRPQCRGLLSAHDNGSPMGEPAPAHIRQARRKAHAAFDELWRHARNRGATRKRAYAWLARRLDLTEDDCHIGQMSNPDMLARVVELSHDKKASRNA